METQLPPKRGHSPPNFRPMSRWINIPLGRKVGLGSGDIVLDETELPPKKGHSPTNFPPMSVVAKRLDASVYHLVRGRPEPRWHCVRWGVQLLPPKVTWPPIFGPCLLWPNGRPSQLLLSSCYNFCTAVSRNNIFTYTGITCSPHPNNTLMLRSYISYFYNALSLRI